MGSIHLYLEDGFDRDGVTVRAGAEARWESDVTTRYQIGLARVIDLTVPDGAPVTVAVAVPGRGLVGEAVVDPAATPHVRVSAATGSMVIRAEAAPPMFA